MAHKFTPLKKDIELPNETGISDITKDTGNASTGPLPPLYYRTDPYYLDGGDYVDANKEQKTPTAIKSPTESASMKGLRSAIRKK